MPRIKLLSACAVLQAPILFKGVAATVPSSSELVSTATALTLQPSPA
jgi:hypothetical protein